MSLILSNNNFIKLLLHTTNQGIQKDFTRYCLLENIRKIIEKEIFFNKVYF